jgi:hypothetical protein
MDYFDLDISDKDLAGAMNISRRNRELIALYLDAVRTRKLTKIELARRLGVDRSVVSRMLKGSANLTFRTEGELLWAMGVDPAQRNLVNWQSVIATPAKQVTHSTSTVKFPGVPFGGTAPTKSSEPGIGKVHAA